MLKNKKVLCAMSGGVDSSVSAALLQKQGYEVYGVTFKLFCYAKNETQERARLDSTSARQACCSLESINNARRVCQKLGIPHYVVDISKKFEKEIIKDFIYEYAAGRTPNPCVRCNQFIKFPALISYAQKLGIDFVATGHYARIKREFPISNFQFSNKLQKPKSKQTTYRLLKGKDRKKDQSYFLWGITQEQLKHILFPIGDYKKTETFNLAKKFGIAGYINKKESQEICFVSGDYRAFLADKAKKYLKKGPIVDTKGKKIGEHKGLLFYTIGQRTGLGISAYNPLYVIKIDVKKNTLIVGEDKEAYLKELKVKNINFISGKAPKNSFSAKVKIRYGMEGEKAQVFPEKRNRAKIIFSKPQRAITSGQSVVFYHRNELLGGGIIIK